MAQEIDFHIRKPFLIPLGLLLLMVMALFVICLVNGQPIAKVIILGFIILPVAGLFVESACRRAKVTSDGITVFKLLRQKTLKFAEMTAVETVMVRKRVFLTLCVDDEFLILSNAYADFPQLVGTLLERVPPQAISEETRQMAKAPPLKSTDIITCWLAVALMAFILYIQLGGKI